MRPTISLGMIVKNEAHHLPKLFESIKDCFDEVVITDTGSTDDTVEIAKNLGARVNHFEWIDDFSAARNFNLSTITTDYVMWMDGDDILENREKFIEFRDHSMHVFDYWLATYHYSSEAVTGKPLCTFARERIFKTNKGLSWKYPIHEGVSPASTKIPVRMNYATTWAIRHVRTEEDIKNDKSRNLKIFEKIKNTPVFDSRMKYYYGKELFESNQFVEAANELSKAAASENMELHDRILALQYCCYAYVACNQFERAITFAHQGLQLDPNRAEFHNIIADSYLKLFKPRSAVPFYSAAKSCVVEVPQGYANAIFNHADSYSIYPTNQLIRVKANLGDIDGAYLDCKEALAKYNHPETEEIRKQLVQFKSGVVSYKNAAPCDDIVITCPPQGAYEWDADLAKEKAMGGSETAGIEVAYWLKKLSGRPVKIFNMRKEAKTCDGVEYIPHEKLAAYLAEFKPFLHIAWRHNFKITDAPTFLWSHDLTTPGLEHHQNYLKYMCLTPFHANYVAATTNIPKEKIIVTRNGIKPERFTGFNVDDKNPFRFVYPNSPDRGLERVMRILDIVREKYPQVELHVHYGIEHLPKWGHQQLHDVLKVMMEERKHWVFYHGATQQDELMKSFKKSAYWLYPSDWIETSCISAMELVGNGVFPIFRKIGGIVDTLSTAVDKGMALQIDSDCITIKEHELYADIVLKAIEDEAYKRVNLDMSELSWENVAKSWLSELPKHFGENR